MRIKKKHIQEKIDPNAVANQAGEVVDAVANELDSDDDTAKSFVKSMAVSENDEMNEDGEGAVSRGIEHGVKSEPEVSDADKLALKQGKPTKKINYGEKDLPFESEIKEGKIARKVIRTIKVKDLK